MHNIDTYYWFYFNINYMNNNEIIDQNYKT